MASSGHTGKQRTDMQALFTAAAATAVTALSIGQNTVAAAEAATKADLQLVVTREQGAPLS